MTSSPSEDLIRMVTELALYGKTTMTGPDGELVEVFL